MMAKRVGAATMVAGLMLGCAQEAPSEAAAGKGVPAPTATAAPRFESKAMAPRRVTMDAPVGWVQRTEGAWTVHQAADKRGHLATTSLGPSDGVVARVAEGIGLLGGSEVHVSDEQTITIGPDQLPARAAPGSCRFGNDEGRMQYAVVDVGDGERMLLVWAAARDTPEDAQRTAFAAIASLRRQK